MDISIAQSMAQLQSAEGLQRRVSSLERSGMSAAEEMALREATEAFEAYFLNMMMREMRRTLNDEQRIIPMSHAERIFTEMLDEVISDKAAAQGGFGLADMLYAQMTMRFRDRD